MDAAAAVTVPVPRSRLASRAPGLAAGVCVALAAGAWQAVMMSTPTNDDFLHLAQAQHLLAGDVPVRDFFDNGLVLQFTLSAASQALVGHRLLSEALVVAVAWAVSAGAAFWLVRHLTGSTWGGVVAAVLLIVSSPRGYSYPKVIVYCVAAALWWAYVSRPTWPRAAALGAWAGLAFYWRPDHGAYVAIGVVLAMFAAHAPRQALARSIAAGCAALAVTAPFFLLVQATLGLPEYAATGFAQAGFQHEGGHEWPRWPLREPADFVRFDPADAWAPTMAIRWTSGSSAAEREAVLRRYGVRVEENDGPDLQHVRLSDRSLHALRSLVNEAVVEDTAGLDRGSATIPWSSWGPIERLRFTYGPLRLRILPGLDEHTRASEALAAMFYLLPVVFLLLALPFRHLLAPHATVRPLLMFGAFAVVVTLGLLRTPYDVRGVDGVAVASVLFAVSAVVLWRTAAADGAVRRSLVSAIAVVFVLLVLKSAAVAGQFGERTGWLAGEWRSPERMAGAWRGVGDRLTASPPLRAFDGRDAGVSVRLASYANACLPPGERLLVLWFAPEIYYYAGRLAAQRHLVFVPAWADLEHEQRMTLAMAERFSPPLAFAGSSLNGVALETYPGLVKYVRREYDAAGSISDGDEEYTVFARRDRPVVRTYGEEMWPCYQ